MNIDNQNARAVAVKTWQDAQQALQRRIEELSGEHLTNEMRGIIDEFKAAIRADERARVARALYEQKENEGVICGAKSAAVFVKGIK